MLALRLYRLFLEKQVECSKVKNFSWNSTFHFDHRCQCSLLSKASLRVANLCGFGRIWCGFPGIHDQSMEIPHSICRNHLQSGQRYTLHDLHKQNGAGCWQCRGSHSPSNCINVINPVPQLLPKLICSVVLHAHS